MLPALDLSRLAAPDIAEPAGDADGAASAASFASLLDVQALTADFFATPRDPSPADAAHADVPDAAAPAPKGPDSGANNVGATNESRGDTARVDDAALLVLTLATPRLVPESPSASAPTDVPSSESAGDTAERATVDESGVMADPLPTASAETTPRTLASAKPEASDATAETLGKARAFFERLTQGPNLDALRDAAKVAATANDPASLDAAAVAARRALASVVNAQASPDRLTSRVDVDALRRQVDTQLHTPRASVLSLNDMQRAVAAFTNNGSAGDSTDQGFTPAKSSTPLGTLASRALHGLMPVPFELSIDNSPQGLSASAGVTLPNDTGVSSSIVQALRLQVTAGGGSAVINLSPDFLGGVKVSVQVDDGAVTATLQANNPQVRAWMESNESVLRQALLEHGLKLDRLIVTDEAAPEFQRDGEPQNGSPRDQASPRQRRRDTGDRFELVA